MVQRMIHIVLAIAVAFVFQGRLEAAASHCASVAGERAMTAAATPAPPCHDAATDAGEAGAMSHDDVSDPSPAELGDCACIALLKACAHTRDMRSVRRIAPFAYAAGVSDAFVSADSSPDWKPPRA